MVGDRGFEPPKSSDNGFTARRDSPSSPITHIYGAAHRIRTCKPLRTNGFQDRLLTTRTYGISMVSRLGIEPRIHALEGRCVIRCASRTYGAGSRT